MAAAVASISAPPPSPSTGRRGMVRRVDSAPSDPRPFSHIPRARRYGGPSLFFGRSSRTATHIKRPEPLLSASCQWYQRPTGLQGTMTLDRRTFLSASASAVALGTAGLPLPTFEPEPESTPGRETRDLQGKEITVHTTANNTDLRLTATDKLTFKPMVQPLETQVCVFVDPTKRAQTIVGIGGALTDASAEVFA